MRHVRLAAVAVSAASLSLGAAASGAVAALDACAPLLSFDDLSDAPPGEAGDAGEGGSEAEADAGAGGFMRDARVSDGSDLCVRADTRLEAWYCEGVLDQSSSTPSRLWECRDAGLTSVKDCPFGCFQAPPGKPDLCAYCNLGDGDYCPSEFSDVYVTYGVEDSYVIHCVGGQPIATPISCDGGTRCVRAAPASHCK